MGRQNPSRSLQRELEIFYGGKRCIVTSSSIAEWHHLDDNSANTSFQNLVPLSPNFNLALRDVTKRAADDKILLLPPHLLPDALFHQASLHFVAWEPALAYGCARLAFFISNVYLSQHPDRSLPFTCEAHHFVRHRFNLTLIGDILDRDIYRCLETCEKIGPRTAVGIFQEAAALYSEFGQLSQATELYDAIDSVRRRFKASPVDPARYAAVLRRDATTRGVREGFTPSVKARLAEAIQAIPGDENTQSSVVNTQAWLLLDQTEFREALDLLEPYYKAYRDKIFTPGGNIRAVSVNAWNAAELFRNYVIALTFSRPTRYRERRERALREAEALFDRAGARPFDLRPGFGVRFSDAISSTETTKAKRSQSQRRLPNAIAKSLERVVRLSRTRAGLS
ncbi:MAG: hypothetical protein HGB26_03545 [Desulfobulbaceae bacterium]|nr:hypothetical protein [Desulfobulbaceae bacterium]